MSNYSITEFQKTKKGFSFEINNVSLTKANSLRRILLSRIPVLAFFKVNIEENTSYQTNTLLDKHIRFIPIHNIEISDIYPKDQCPNCGNDLDRECSECAIIYSFEETNNTNEMIMAMSSCIKPIEEKYFQNTPIHNFPIIELQPGQSIRGKILAIRYYRSYDASFSCVSNVTPPLYTELKNDKSSTEELHKKILQIRKQSIIDNVKTEEVIHTIPSLNLKNVQSDEQTLNSADYVSNFKMEGYKSYYIQVDLVGNLSSNLVFDLLMKKFEQ